MCGSEVVLINFKLYSKLHQEKYTYMPLARRRISQLRTSTLQPSVAKLFAEIRSKIMPSLSWSGVVIKMAYGPGESDMRGICCRELFTAITAVLEQNKETFVRKASHD